MDLYVFCTSKCNMACLHCCHTCRPGVGKNMSFETFKEIVKFSRRNQFRLMLGGGEPTLNPHLLEMIRYLEEHGYDQNRHSSVWLTMNGSCSTALYKELLRDECVNLQISNSIFHNRKIQNPFVMRSAARRGLTTDSGYWYHGSWTMVELVGRARYRVKEIEALAKKKHARVEFSGASDDSVCILPDGQLCVWNMGRKQLFGPLTKANYNRASEWGREQCRLHRGSSNSI